ncbi:hypothetical protein B296_00005836 [Ensete ventricosum]|uniref:Uncharacterized protein n=1 Tax=Ensete ventricosum TaxID=4639 RepID=A0A427B690_ENSVE|nr:hypothetical protein B296_00005836 [Ensete ventricosum]
MAPLQSITVRSPCGSCSCKILYHISNTHWNQHCVGRLRVAVEGKKGSRRVEEDPDLGNEKVKPRLTWPRPCLLRPPFLRLKVCRKDEEIEIRSVTEERHRSYGFDGSPSSGPRCGIDHLGFRLKASTAK